MAGHSDFWTAERIETLKNLWSQGLSASKVATSMGIDSRCAIIGKVHRLKLKRTVGHEYWIVNRELRQPRERAIPHRPFRKSVFKSREKKPALDVPNPRSKPGLFMVTSVITGNPLAAKRRPPPQREMTKTEQRDMLTQAVRNTANMGGT